MKLLQLMLVMGLLGLITGGGLFMLSRMRGNVNLQTMGRGYMIVSAGFLLFRAALAWIVSARAKRRKKRKTASMA